MRSFRTPLLRLRLELDRALRGRAFLGRAVRGDVSEEEYLDLIAQLGCLLFAFTGEQGAEILAPLAGDVVAIGAPSRRSRTRAPFVAACFARDLVTSRCFRLPADQTRDIAVAVVGTSWTGQAADRLGARFPAGTSFLAEVERAGGDGMARLDAAARASAVDLEHAHAFAELVRGALLGLATYLDLTWPAPTVTHLVPEHSGGDR